MKLKFRIITAVILVTVLFISGFTSGGIVGDHELLQKVMAADEEGGNGNTAEESSGATSEESSEAGTEKGSETTSEESSETGTEEGSEATSEESSETGTEEGSETTSEESSEAGTEESSGTTSEASTETTEEQIKNSSLVETGLSPVTAKVLVLDPGHCKKHPGASGNGLKEEVVVLDISKAIYENLKNYGDITVYMTRETSDCCRNLGLGDCLYARSNYAKQLSADFLLSIHINAGRLNGANALVAYKSGYHDSVRVQTQTFGRIALRELRNIGIKSRGFLLRKSGTGRYANGRRADYYAIVRRGVTDQIPAVIMEHGYITSASDCKRFFKTAAQRSMVGAADANAVIAYFGLSQMTVAGSFADEGADRYFVNTEGKKVCGWVKNEGMWYHFDETTGKMSKGFLTQGDNTFYLHPVTGQMITGEFAADGNDYLARGNGTLVKGVVHGDGVGTYLFDLVGRKLKKGFHTVGNDVYYVVNNKKVASGLTKIGTKYYGFDTETKKMVKGWYKFNGKYYYFDEETGKMQKSKWIGKYYVNKKGVRTKKK